MALKLTTRQNQVLSLVREAIVRTGRPPTRAEIAQEFGFRSANAAEDHLRALARKGYIRLTAGTSRGIQLTDAAFLPTPGAAHTPATQSSAKAEASPRPGPTHERSRLALARGASRTVPIPLVGQVAAGRPILAAEHVERELALSSDLFTAMPDYLLRVRGDSMRDAGILDGDLLAVRSTREAHHRQVIVARLGDEVTVKRLDTHGAMPRLLPENPDYDAIVIQPSDDFSVEGIAVGLIRTLSAR